MGLATIILFAAVPIGIAVAIIAMQVHSPDRPVMEALRTWQSGLGALLGLFGIAVSSLIQDYSAVERQRGNEYRDGLTLAITMQAEGFEVRRWLKDIEERLARLEAAAPNDVKTQCALLVVWHGQHQYTSLGIIAANLNNVGKMPHMLPTYFVDILTRQRDLTRRIAGISEENCRRDGKLQLDVVREGIGNMHSALDNAQKVMERLPGLHKFNVTY